MHVSEPTLLPGSSGVRSWYCSHFPSGTPQEVWGGSQACVAPWCGQRLFYHRVCYRKEAEVCNGGLVLWKRPIEGQTGVGLADSFEGAGWNFLTTMLGVVDRPKE